MSTNTSQTSTNRSGQHKRNGQQNRGRNQRGANRPNSGNVPVNQNLDPLVIEALDFINKHSDNKTVFKCFNKRNGVLSTFGVYNYTTKKYSIHHATNFFDDDFMDIKVVALDKGGKKR